MLISITCVYGYTRYVPAHTVTITSSSGSLSVQVGIMKDLPIPLLLGRDWPRFQALLPPPRPQWKARAKTALLATESEIEGELDNRNNDVLHDLFQQVMSKGSFTREQREDEKLKNCWGQVRIVGREQQHPPPHPFPHFILQNGLLYCIAIRGEEKQLLVVPCTKQKY